MPFGLSNAPATFQRLMMNVTKGLEITPYLDDIIVPTTNYQENLNLLKFIFDRFRHANFKLKPSKCSFLKREVKYLGYIIKDKKVLADPEKIKVIQTAEFPTTSKQLQRFLGLCNFLSQFIPNYASLAAELSTIKNKKTTRI